MVECRTEKGVRVGAGGGGRGYLFCCMSKPYQHWPHVLERKTLCSYQNDLSWLQVIALSYVAKVSSKMFHLSYLSSAVGENAHHLHHHFSIISAQSPNTYRWQNILQARARLSYFLQERRQAGGKTEKKLSDALISPYPNNTTDCTRRHPWWEKLRQFQKRQNYYHG